MELCRTINYEDAWLSCQRVELTNGEKAVATLVTMMLPTLQLLRTNSTYSCDSTNIMKITNKVPLKADNHSHYDTLKYCSGIFGIADYFLNYCNKII